MSNLTQIRRGIYLYNNPEVKEVKEMDYCVHPYTILFASKRRQFSARVNSRMSIEEYISRIDERISHSEFPMILAVEKGVQFWDILKRLKKLNPVAPRYLTKTRIEDSEPIRLGGRGTRYERVARFIRNSISPEILNVFGCYHLVGEDAGCCGDTYWELMHILDEDIFCEDSKVKLIRELCLNVSI